MVRLPFLLQVCFWRPILQLRVLSIGTFFFADVETTGELQIWTIRKMQNTMVCWSSDLTTESSKGLHTLIDYETATVWDSATFEQDKIGFGQYSRFAIRDFESAVCAVLAFSEIARELQLGTVQHVGKNEVTPRETTHAIARAFLKAKLQFYRGKTLMSGLSVFVLERHPRATSKVFGACFRHCFISETSIFGGFATAKA